MKATAYFGKLGVSFRCSVCGAILKGRDGDTLLIHPQFRGLVVKRPIVCAAVDQVFKNPFYEMELQRGSRAEGSD